MRKELILIKNDYEKIIKAGDDDLMRPKLEKLSNSRIDLMAGLENRLESLSKIWTEGSYIDFVHDLEVPFLVFSGKTLRLESRIFTIYPSSKKTHSKKKASMPFLALGGDMRVKSKPFKAPKDDEITWQPQVDFGKMVLENQIFFSLLRLYKKNALCSKIK